MRHRYSVFSSLALALASWGCTTVVQQADLSFEPAVPRPAHAKGEGPLVLIDEGHFNYHTTEGRYAPFAKLLRRDGYVVRGLDGPATSESLATARIFVIANPIAESDRKGWKLPTEQAFTETEIETIHDWVAGGGSLLLIADHMPFPGSTADLATAFGILFGNGFAFDAEGNSKITFTVDGGGLADHAITQGRGDAERIDSVRVFTGQGFRADGEVEPLLTLPVGSKLLLPVKAWKFSDRTPQVPASGMLQGAVLRHDQGRVAVFGEAAMFSAQEQIRGETRTAMGMNAPDAEQNAQFLLNVVHWLSGLIG